MVSDTKGSPDRFGYEWGEYSEILPQYEEQFKNWTTLLPKSFWKDQTFLDVGCGMGRNSYWPLTYGAKKAVSIDVDDRSLESARINLKPFHNAEVLKISAYDIPFENEFDMAFSIGVIHHLEHPKLALAKMKKSVKGGGRFLSGFMVMKTAVGLFIFLILLDVCFFQSCLFL